MGAEQSTEAVDDVTEWTSSGEQINGVTIPYTIPYELREILKNTACDVIDQNAHDLQELSNKIWENPELSLEEHDAHKNLTDFFESRGFPVERSYVMETGFRCQVDHGNGACVAVLCEYDALPGMGHACGHNLIAEAGVAAAMGIKSAMEVAKQNGKPLGKLHVLGTPGEESGNGKGRMIEAGAFDKVDAAMMVHPTPVSFADPDNKLIGIMQVDVTFRGKASHASSWPWEGVNALDAAVLAYTNVSVMRQQLPPKNLVHGVITDGGRKPNIIPDKTSMDYYIRAPTRSSLDQLKTKIENCFQAAATATGCEVEITWSKDQYLNMMSNKIMVDLYRANAEKLGAEFADGDNSTHGGASSDMGNVSYSVPSIHPLFAIPTDAFNHQKEFAVSTGAEASQAPTLQAAKALAMTAIDIMCDPDGLRVIKSSFREQLSKA